MRPSAALSLLLLAVALLTRPAAADQRVGAFTPLSPELTMEAPLVQTTPSVASDGEGYLAVWLDFRSGVGQIFGTLVGGDGELLTPYGFVLEDSAPIHSAPEVAWNGSAYLVVWTSRVAGSSSEVRGALVSREGTILKPAFTLVPEASSIRLTSRGTEFLLLSRAAWGAVRATRLGTEGAVLGHSYPGDAAAAIPDGDGYLLLVREGGRVHAVRMMSGGVLRARGVLGDDRNRRAIFAATNGETVLATWGSDDGIGVRILREGSLAQEVLSIRGVYSAPVAWTGSCFVVSTLRLADSRWVIDAYFFSADGTPLNSEPQLVAEAAREPLSLSVAGAAGAAIVVWEDDFAGRYERSESRRIASSLVRGCSGDHSETVVLSRSSVPQFNPAIAPATDGYVVVWEEFTENQEEATRLRSSTLHAMWLDYNGQPRRSTARTIDPSERPRGPHSVATDPSGAVVIWQAGDTLTASRVPRDPALPISSRELPLDAGASAVAFNGAYYLAASVTYARDSPTPLIEGVRLAPDLEILDPAPRSLGEGSRIAELRWDGNEFVLIASHIEHQCEFLCLWGPVGSRMRTISSEAIVLRERELDPDQYGDVAASCNTEACTVAAPHPSWKTPALELMVVEGHDGPLTRIELPLESKPLQPEVIWDGRHFQIFWASPGESGMLVLRHGTLVHGELIVHEQPVGVYSRIPAEWNGPEPTAASRGDGRAILVHGEIVPEAGNVKRLGTRTIGTPGPRRGVRPPAAGDTSAAPGVRQEIDQ